MGLYFGFVLETVLITGHFCYCWAVLTQDSVYTEHRPALPLTPPHQWTGWGCQDSWPGEQRDTPHFVVSCSATKVGKYKEGRTVRVMVFASTSPCYVCGSLVFLEISEPLAVHWKWWMNFLFSFACVCVTFASLTKLSLSQPTRFSCTSLPHPTTREWMSDCMGLSCKLGLNHHITTLSSVFSTVKGKGY